MARRGVPIEAPVEAVAKLHGHRASGQELRDGVVEPAPRFGVDVALAPLHPDLELFAEGRHVGREVSKSRGIEVGDLEGRQLDIGGRHHALLGSSGGTGSANGGTVATSGRPGRSANVGMSRVTSPRGTRAA
jgi:hypothetical protein